jgi:hypothetical protein
LPAFLERTVKYLEMVQSLKQRGLRSCAGEMPILEGQKDARLFMLREPEGAAMVCQPRGFLVFPAACGKRFEPHSVASGGNLDQKKARRGKPHHLNVK